MYLREFNDASRSQLRWLLNVFLPNVISRLQVFRAEHEIIGDEII